MADRFDTEAQDQRRRDEDRLAKARADLIKADFLAVMGTEAGRRLVQGFLLAMDLDESPFNGNGATMAYAVGKQDAARWFQKGIRQYCPHLESVMQAEFRKIDRRLRNEPPVEDDD